MNQVIHQLRTYEIFEHNKDAFHARFRDHAWRIMRTYNFEILALWESAQDDGIDFVYLLEWPDEITMHHAWDRFRSDEEWNEIKRVTGAEHGPLVGEISERTLTPTSYSPTLL